MYTGGLVDDYRMVRNKATDGPACVFTAKQPKYDQSKVVPVPVKKGNFEHDMHIRIIIITSFEPISSNIKLSGTTKPRD